jgi:lipopolysaccharide/colanic/teichoic acid biosynthesis glycosyltransferase
MIKRLFDITMAFFAILLLTPIMLSVSIAVFFSDFHSPLFRQKRVGRLGREFEMLKFRSMVVNADRMGNYYTSEDDPRITSLGKFIRRTSLDELPQLCNVLKGDMSLVGPRPDVINQRSLYSETEWRLRCSVRPGITGLAQATFRSDATEEQRKNMDFYYIKHQSFFYDLYIIFLTFKQIFGKGGN